MIEPRQIIEESDSEISINWSDDTETKFNARDLRSSFLGSGFTRKGSAADHQL
jgi:hypothetical protein